MKKLFTLVLVTGVMISCASEEVKEVIEEKAPEVNVEEVLEIENKSEELHQSTEAIKSDIKVMDEELDSLLTL